MRKNRYIITPVLFLVLLAVLLLYGLWQDENYHTESTQTLSCKIVAVADGDTLTAQCNAMGKAGQVRIRLMAIDAPEYDYKNAVNIQPYAAQSRDHLKTMCLHKEAEISVYYEDQYGRSVADVRCQGVDVSVAQIEAGMAWVYDRYASDYQYLYAVQKKAREAKAGLWTSSNPIPPWQWRQARRRE